MAPSRRSQPGELGKHAGRSMKRTMQRRNARTRRGLLAETGDSWVATRCKVGEAWHRGSSTTGSCHEPTGVGSAARVEGTAGKVGKVSRVAEVLPHSEGAAYKRQAVKSPRAGETDGWGRSTR